ncbi:MAG: serine/threonine protein phosphatase [Isosphaeraceae bacterium]|jgi:Icc-related predicted phosphoesterase|nr:MAG: serine/threonine protein phosphatase [Isosphaeraceae bacterium]
MRLLLFSDLHRDTGAARRLVERADAADVIVGAGDFATVRRGVDDCIEVLQAIGKPAVLVAGNNETTDELRSACRHWPSAIVLHGDGTTIAGVPFFGLGGGVPVTPFGSWSHDFTEEQAEALLAACPPRAVLIAHSPPRGVVDRDSSGRSLGSVAVRAAIERSAPRLVVCGHIHASGGQFELVGQTPVVNAGPAGCLWDLEAQEPILSSQ